METSEPLGLDASLERRGPTPIFQQIRGRIGAAISSGQMAPHRGIPSERESSLHVGVSRMTVRQALEALAHEGRLYSLLRGRYGLTMDRASQSIEATEPTPEEQRLRRLECPRPELRIARQTSAAAGRMELG